MLRAGVMHSSSSTAAPLIEDLLVINGGVNGCSTSAILIDSGATSTFIARSFVILHGMSTSPLSDCMKVRLANGAHVTCSMVVPSARLNVDEIGRAHV